VAGVQEQLHPINHEKENQKMTTDDTKKIAELNDLCRTAMGLAGKVYQTRGITALRPEDQSAIREKVETFNAFTPDNDPHKERDFRVFEHNGNRIFWKIDYYDKLRHHANQGQRRPERPKADHPGFDDHARLRILTASPAPASRQEHWRGVFLSNKVKF
jgi:hypothetical protein